MDNQQVIIVKPGRGQVSGLQQASHQDFLGIR